MRQLIKSLALPVLHLIRSVLEVIKRHALPGPHDTEGIYGPQGADFGTFSAVNPDTDFGAYRHYVEDELRDSYDYFKQYFHEAIFLHDRSKLRAYAVNTAILNHRSDYYYLEFGVWLGRSINQAAEILRTLEDGTRIYGFDSFEGLREDWKGHLAPRGSFSLDKKVPPLSDNCVPVVGWIEDTLPQFISERKDLEINFVHIDTDTYLSAKTILRCVKPHLVNNAVILFDELYNFSGWSTGEFKALKEEFSEEEFNFLAFARQGRQVVIQYKKS